MALDPSRVDAPIPIMEGPEDAPTPAPGYHVNVLEPESGIPESWGPYQQFPDTPERIFAGMEGRMVFLRFPDTETAEAVLAGLSLPEAA